jgi:hypothetical protein
MTGDDVGRAALKRACLRHLEAGASEHPAGHQGKLAARYVLRSASGEGIELMFEKGPATPAHLWILRQFADSLSDAGIMSKHSPAALLYQQTDTAGRPKYGRHSALRPMRQLANADLTCFTIEHEAEIERILADLVLV